MAACAGLALAGVAGPVSAQDTPAMAGMEHRAPVDCSLVRMALPPELAGWSSRAPAPAAKDKGGLKKAALTVGKAVDAGLMRTSDVRYILRPEKPGGSVSYGGMFGFTISEAGTYRVALGSGAWIDLVKDGKAVESSNHGHGPDCTGVRKMVDFPLVPGRYVLQLAANGGEGLPVMIAKLP
ncbi:MAG TPA: homogentisate 1,2-dioxygenase [Sphingobium sp.]|uniref:homogentisate 1,2-dioxygenase n=1 Tax=Sphingobium sp. TaxID=1912891 RepID=UPI002ED52F1F